MISLTPTEILQRVHIRYEGDTSYPTSGDEDYIIRLAYLDDAVSALEREALQGVKFDFLKEDASIQANGTGTDALPSNFLDFMTDYIKTGSTEYVRVSKEKGAFNSQAGNSPYIFWKEGSNIRSIPEFNGTITFPYLRKFNRFPLGTETESADGDGQYYVEYILAMLYLDDGDLNQYNLHANNAKDILDLMRANSLIDAPNQSTFGLGM